MQWNLLNPTNPNTLAELQAVLLANRGVSDVQSFLTPPQPSDLSLAEVGLDPVQVMAAVERIRQALKAQQKVLVFGDYDADGICATAVMWLTLHQLGCQATPFIPDRLKHGYGLSLLAIDEILAQGKPDLIVTVDNGIVAHPAVARLIAAGVEVLITDHHSPEATLPAATQIVHTTQLCGTTVAWMFARELWRELKGQPAEADHLLDLCGVATIADQVPLREANRAFAYWGIEALKTTPRPGIKALCQVAEMTQLELTTNSIHYGIAPRINAMGRLEHGMDALRLLCTSNLERAQVLAQSISLTNVKRQTLTSELLEIALAESKVWESEHLIIVDSPAYHEGVIGLIAGKLMETYYKPAIVIAVGETKAKASARSIAGVNIVDLIRLVRDDLLEVGGHPMAAGFGLLSEKIPLVKKRLLALAKTEIKPEQLQPQITIECLVGPALLTEATCSMIQKLAPFGQGNPEPVLGLPEMKVLDLHFIGQQKQHLKLLVAPANDTAARPVTALGWNLSQQAAGWEPGQTADLAVCLEMNEWRNKRSLQLKIKDVRVGG